MEIIFIYGPAAAGKLTVSRELAKITSLALFHNHLVVDAVGAVFSFGTEPFIQLRESFWIQTFSAAARIGRSLIFTFAPEATVDTGFPERVRATVAPFGGSVVFIELTVRPKSRSAGSLLRAAWSLKSSARSTCCANCAASLTTAWRPCPSQTC